MGNLFPAVRGTERKWSQPQTNLVLCDQLRGAVWGMRQKLCAVRLGCCTACLQLFPQALPILPRRASCLSAFCSSHVLFTFVLAPNCLVCGSPRLVVLSSLCSMHSSETFSCVEKRVKTGTWLEQKTVLAWSLKETCNALFWNPTLGMHIL